MILARGRAAAHMLALKGTGLGFVALAAVALIALGWRGRVAPAHVALAALSAAPESRPSAHQREARRT